MQSALVSLEQSAAQQILLMALYMYLMLQGSHTESACVASCSTIMRQVRVAAATRSLYAQVPGSQEVCCAGTTFSNGCVSLQEIFGRTCCHFSPLRPPCCVSGCSPGPQLIGPSLRTCCPSQWSLGHLCPITPSWHTTLPTADGYWLMCDPSSSATSQASCTSCQALLQYRAILKQAAVLRFGLLGSLFFLSVTLQKKVCNSVVAARLTA